MKRADIANFFTTAELDAAAAAQSANYFLATVCTASWYRRKVLT